MDIEESEKHAQTWAAFVDDITRPLDEAKAISISIGTSSFNYDNTFDTINNPVGEKAKSPFQDVVQKGVEFTVAIYGNIR